METWEEDIHILVSVKKIRMNVANIPGKDSNKWGEPCIRYKGIQVPSFFRI
jgi:hypothetical protein